jgi:DNA-binding NarL/FixJ family response regulator
MPLANDHRLFMEGLSRLLVLTCEAKRMVTNGRELVSTTGLVANVVIPDPSVTVLNGMALRMLRRAAIRSKFLLVTVHSRVSVAAEECRSVASAYALKQASAEGIYAAIPPALCGRKYFSASFPVELVILLAEPVRRPYKEEPELRCHQREVLPLVAERKTMKKAPNLLNPSTRTVESYQYEIMNALAVHSSAEPCPMCNARGGDYRRTNAFCAA